MEGGVGGTQNTYRNEQKEGLGRLASNYGYTWSVCHEGLIMDIHGQFAMKV